MDGTEQSNPANLSGQKTVQSESIAPTPGPSKEQEATSSMFDLLNKSSNNESQVDSGSDSDHTEETETTKVMGDWFHEPTFVSREKFLEYIGKENCWVHYRSCITNRGMKTIYRCNQVKVQNALRPFFLFITWLLTTIHVNYIGK